MLQKAEAQGHAENRAVLMRTDLPGQRPVGEGQAGAERKKRLAVVPVLCRKERQCFRAGTRKPAVPCGLTVRPGATRRSCSDIGLSAVNLFG